MADETRRMNHSAAELDEAIGKVAEMETSKANAEDVYDKVTADSRFLAVNGTAQKAEADGTGANIAGSIAALQTAFNALTVRVEALEEALGEGGGT